MINKTLLEERLDQIISPVIHSRTPGMALIISRGEEILIRKTYGMADLQKNIPVTLDHQFAIASNTKQFTCMAIMMLKEQGLLDYDEPIAKFFPDFPDYRHQITIRHLMNHQSGIPDYTEAPDWLTEHRETLPADMLEFIKSLGDLNFAPGERFSYCNSGYVMLGSIVSQLTGMPFGTFLEQNILAPAGMAHACAPDSASRRAPHLAEGYNLEEDGSYVKQPYDMALVGYADGNIQATADDMLAWHHYLYGGAQKLVKPETLAEALAEQCETDMEDCAYGFGLIKSENKGCREIWHGGGTMGFSSRCSRYIDEDLSIIMLTNVLGLPKYELYHKIAAEVFAVLDEEE